MGNNLTSKRVKNSYSEKEAEHFCCKICSKPLPEEYFEIMVKDNPAKLNVCSNDCESAMWNILSNLGYKNK